MKIILLGETATGKDTIANELRKQYHYKVAKSHTTREKRNPDEDAYYFINDEEYLSIPDENKIAHTTINHNHYFLTYDEFKNADILILDPIGLDECLERYPREGFIVFHIDASEKDRKAAYEKRNSKISFEERQKEDQRLFHQFYLDLETTLKRSKSGDDYVVYSSYALVFSYVNRFDEESLNQITDEIHDIYQTFQNLKQLLTTTYHQDIHDRAVFYTFDDPKLCQYLLFDLCKPKAAEFNIINRRLILK